MQFANVVTIIIQMNNKLECKLKSHTKCTTKRGEDRAKIQTQKENIMGQCGVNNKELWGHWRSQILS